MTNGKRTAQHQDPPAFIGASDAAQLIGLSRSGFYNFVARGILPPPIRLGARTLWDAEGLVSAVKARKSDAGNSLQPITVE
jgi:predicted DNA-binding transcriptional regulator AlpA